MKTHWVKNDTIPCSDSKSLASGHTWSNDKKRVTCKKCLNIIKKDESIKCSK